MDEMDEQGVLKSLERGELAVAIAQLERAAQDTGYASDLINHAYTLALHRAGQTARLAEAAFSIASSLVRTDPALAMDYFQRALCAGLDGPRVRAIGAVHEQWRSAARADANVTHLGHVAHVIGCLRSGDPTTHYLKMLVPSLAAVGVESTIFTTEAQASWFYNPAGSLQSQPMEIGGKTVIADVEGDFADRAEKVTAAIRAAGVSVALFHVDLCEQISVRVAALRPGKVQIHVIHGSELEADLFDGYIHLSRSGLERRRFESHPAAWIPVPSDAEDRLALCRPLTRRSLGLESAGSVSATFCDLNEVSGSTYLKVLAELLKRFPAHIHLFGGAGNVRAIRGFLHAEGVLPRVRFLGPIPDMISLLGLVDLYLAAWPGRGTTAILEAMAAAKPVVLLSSPTASEIADPGDLPAANEAEYIEIADRLIRSPSLREQYGQRMKHRFSQEFRPQMLGKRYVEFLQRFARPEWPLGEQSSLNI